MADYADFKLDSADVWYEKHSYEDALYFAECAKVGTAHLIIVSHHKDAKVCALLSSLLQVSKS